MRMLVELDIGDWNDEFIGDEATELIETMLLGHVTTWIGNDDAEKIVEISEIIDVKVIGD